jgi:hypothetical protein
MSSHNQKENPFKIDLPADYKVTFIDELCLKSLPCQHRVTLMHEGNRLVVTLAAPQIAELMEQGRCGFEHYAEHFLQYCNEETCEKYREWFQQGCRIQQNKFYVFISYAYAGASVEVIVEAKDDQECVEKIMKNYDRFDELFAKNMTGGWCKGGLQSFLYPRSYHVDEVASKWYDDMELLENDKSYRQKLVQENQQTILQWLPCYDKECEGSGIDIHIMKSLPIL